MAKAMKLVSGRDSSGVYRVYSCTWTKPLNVQPTVCLGSPFCVGWNPIFISEPRKHRQALSVFPSMTTPGPSQGTVLGSMGCWPRFYSFSRCVVLRWLLSQSGSQCLSPL